MNNSSSQSRDVVNKMFRSIEGGEIEAVRACFEPDAVIWHNDDQIEKGVDDTASVLQWLCSITSRRSYENQTIYWDGNVAISHHLMVADLTAGGQFRLPVLMRIIISDGGLVSRVDEYYDSRATDSLSGR